MNVATENPTDGLRYFCCTENRRRLARADGNVNGIDYLEVSDDQKTLTVYLLKNVATPPVVQIEGGERIKDIHVELVTVDQNALTVTVDQPGDYAIYTLRLSDETNIFNLDPLLTAVDFSFKVDCSSDLDCQTILPCPPLPTETPEIDYLARDYEGLRGLMQDRIAQLLPDWPGPHPADMTTALVELLAYVGDRISYAQDAVATEAYLGTARLRESVRRHARLLDYRLHDGANARVWVQIQVDEKLAAPLILPKGTALLTAVGEILPTAIEPLSPEWRQGLRANPVVFETLEEATLAPKYNEFDFHTWGEDECCLPAGARRATLKGKYDVDLIGKVLIFAEVCGAKTGNPADADLAHRYPVRITSVHPTTDPLAPNGAQDVTEIAWRDEDALPFALCISSRAVGGKPVSRAFGNIVLADHGRTVQEKSTLDKGDAGKGVTENTTLKVPQLDPRFVLTPARTNRVGGACEDISSLPSPPRFRPMLSEVPVTQAVPYPATVDNDASLRPTADCLLPANASTVALPQIILTDDRGSDWLPLHDLLQSNEMDTSFVAEIGDDAQATLRFGDDMQGRRPPAEMAFSATYRVGNGGAGNIGADSLTHIVTDVQSIRQGIKKVRNWLPACGGIDPEPIENARQFAPFAFRVPERAVKPEDYAMMALRHPYVQRAVATRRWTGSWYTIFLTIDRFGGLPVTTEFERDLRRFLERYRMAGEDLEIDGPRNVPLEITLDICVTPHTYRGDVRGEILRALSRGVLSDGRRGLFHPDRLTFGQTVFASQIIEAAQSVPGVASVTMTQFRRRGVTASKVPNELKMGRLEIARLDNDPNFPERGTLTLKLKGGR